MLKIYAKINALPRYVNKGLIKKCYSRPHHDEGFIHLLSLFYSLFVTLLYMKYLYETIYALLSLLVT